MSAVNMNVPFPTESAESESIAVTWGLCLPTRAWRSISFLLTCFVLQPAARMTSGKMSKTDLFIKSIAVRMY